jgi:kynurenine formamidase
VTRQSLVGRATAPAVLLLGGVLWAAGPQGTDPTPIGPKWWPSPWGADDQRGAANRLTPEKVKEASRLIRDGRVYPLGRRYEYGMPLPGKRHFSLTIPGSPTGGPDGDNRLVYHDDLFSGEIGQIGTQLDGLGHVGVRVGGDDVFYNGFKRSEFGKPYGLEKLGIENVGVFFTRGVLIDVAAFKGVDRLKVGEVITDRDLQGALKAQGVEIREGDVALIRTGHGALWMKDNAEYARGEPGIGLAAARWLCARNIVLVGSDNWATEVIPPEDPRRPFDVHPELLVRNGVYNLENLDLDALARDRAYEFAFVFAPLPIKGATGSPGNPVAVR